VYFASLPSTPTQRVIKVDPCVACACLPFSLLAQKWRTNSFLYTQSYVHLPPPGAQALSDSDMHAFLRRFYHRPRTRPDSSAVHRVFYLREMHRLIGSFLKGG
jgi:hypothetical protein